MRFIPFVLGGLLLAAALPALAQTPAETPAAPRFYVGLGAYSSYYQPFGGNAISSTGLRVPAQSTGLRVPVQLVAGYQLRPRLALQMGMAYGGSTNDYRYEGIQYYYSGTGIQSAYSRYRATNTARTTSVSVLARYTLTRNPAHRVQFDALGGFTLEHQRSYLRGTQADSVGGALVESDFSYRSSRNTLLLTAGLGTRLRLSPRFGLFYDFTLNKNLNRAGYLPGSLTGSSALGLRYRFGR